jgi:uncharacterized protein
MLFKRRHRRPFWNRVRNFLFPAMGWRRYFLYWRARTLRLPGSASSIAKGFACGAAASFTPLLGFHMGLTCLLCWILGGNYIAGAIGTLLGNPFTLVPILFLIYSTGSLILGQEPQPGSIQKLIHAATSHPADIPAEFAKLFEPVFLPMLIGCVPVAIGIWLISYVLCHRVVHKYKQVRLHLRVRKAQHYRAEQDAPPSDSL